MVKHNYFTLRERILIYLELKRNWIFPIITLATYQILILVFKLHHHDIFISIGKGDLHNHILFMSTLLASFLFLGICILVAASEKKIFKLLSKGGYLKITYTSIYLGIITLLGTIGFSFASMINFIEDIQPILVNLEISIFLIGVTYFIMSVWKMSENLKWVYQENIETDDE